MIEISVFQIIIQMHGEYWNATTNDCKILDRDRHLFSDHSNYSYIRNMHHIDS